MDPSGKRTIGVLTKPDLINPGGEAEVLEVLSNNRKPLKLGYVMVKVIRLVIVVYMYNIVGSVLSILKKQMSLLECPWPKNEGGCLFST